MPLQSRRGQHGPMLCQAWFSIHVLTRKRPILSEYGVVMFAGALVGTTDKLSSLESTIRLLQENNTHLSRLVSDQARGKMRMRNDTGPHLVALEYH